MAPDSTVRMSNDLLERASSLNPDNRSEVIREATDRGLQEMERERVLEQAEDMETISRRIFREELASSGVDAAVRGLLEQTKMAQASPKIMRVPLFSKGGECLPAEASPVFVAKPGETLELEVPVVYWMVYESTNIRIHVEDPEAIVEVSKLCSDGGSGRDLLLKGWHRPEAFLPPGTVLAKQECITAPDSLTLLVRSNRPTRVAISLEIKTIRDDAFGPGRIDNPLQRERGHVLSVPLPPTQSLGSGRKVRLPLLEASPPDVPTEWTRLETAPTNWGVLRVFAPLFKGPRLFNTLLRNFKIGGSPNLLPYDNQCSALDYVDETAGLRAYPVLISPNHSFLEVKDLHKNAEVSLLVEVMREDAFLR